MTSDLNPYTPGRESSEMPNVARGHDRYKLHRGIGALVGSACGACLAIFFAFMLYAFSMESGFLKWLELGGMYPEIGLLTVPVCAFPGGLLGGVLCGTLRGNRLPLAIAIASAPALFILITGTLFSENIREIWLVSTILLASCVGSTLCCHWIVRWIGYKRSVVISIIAEKESTHLGFIASVVSCLFAICSILGCALVFLLIGLFAEYPAGITITVALFGALHGLVVMSAYPNRWWIGGVSCTLCFSAMLCIVIRAFTY